MPHYGTLGTTTFAQAGEDIRGSKLYGLDDEKLGKIDDVIFDHTTGTINYVVVDTGGWLSSKKFLVPAGRLRASAEHENDYHVPLTKSQIESFPPFDESDLNDDKRWSDYEGRYRSKWETGPVMHRAETDRNITPTTQQMPGNSPSARASGDASDTNVVGGTARQSRAADVAAAAAPSDRVIPAGHDTVEIANSAVGIGSRWDTFQSRLRERRKEAVATCNTCTEESATKRNSQSADSLREAV